MRYALALCLATCAFSAQAATIDFTLSNQPGSTSWSLEWIANGPIGISAIALEVSTSLGPFTPAAGLVPVCCEVYDPLPDGRNLLLLQAATGQVFVPSFTQPVLLGTFAATTDSASLVELVGAENSAGFTVLDATGAPIPDYTITIVPEPGAASLLGLAALLLGSARLPRAAKRISRPAYAAGCSVAECESRSRFRCCSLPRRLERSRSTSS